MFFFLINIFFLNNKKAQLLNKNQNCNQFNFFNLLHLLRLRIERRVLSNYLDFLRFELLKFTFNISA